jgi:hypothetical protein
VGIGSDPYPETMWVYVVVCGLPGLKCSDHKGCVPIALPLEIPSQYQDIVYERQNHFPIQTPG